MGDFFHTFMLHKDLLTEKLMHKCIHILMMTWWHYNCKLKLIKFKNSVALWFRDLYKFMYKNTFMQLLYLFSLGYSGNSF